MQNVESLFLGGSLFVMLIFVLIATIVRISRVPFITWSEELSRTLMVWMGLIGSGAVAKTGEHFSVNAVYTAFKSENVRRGFFVVIQIAVLFYGVFTTYYGIVLCTKLHTMGQLSPALQTPMWISYLVLIVFGISVSIQSLIYYIPLITGKKKYVSDSTLDNAE